jgi:hypothetical protein
LRTIDRIGKKYHQLQILSVSHKKGNQVFVNTLCDCGGTKVICLDNIVRTTRPTKSCGCLYLKNINAFKNTEPNYISEFNRWHSKDVIARDLECSLDCEQWIKLISGACFYCGEPGNKQMHSSQAFYCNGIDRVDNNKGYHLDNCVSCCGICNMAKRSMPADKFIAWILKAATHLSK